MSKPKKEFPEIRHINWRSGGGLGKQIMATAVLKALRSQNPDAVIHAMTSYPEAFTGLEDVVDRTYPLNVVPHFYEDHKQYEVMEVEPYTDLQYRSGELHLIEAWCKMLGIQAPSTLAGVINLLDEEKKAAEQFLGQVKLDRPLIAFQPFGGTSYYSPQEANNPTRPMHYRELPANTAQEIVDHLVNLGYAVVHIGLPTEPQLKNCLRLTDKDPLNPRYIFALLDRCQYGIFIDSFAQHAWAALGKKNAIVLWGGTNPKTLGYTTNVNMTQPKSCTNLHCNRPNTFMFDFGGNGQPWRCVVGGKCMKFDSKDVVRRFIETNETSKIEQFEKMLKKDGKEGTPPAPAMSMGKPEDITPVP
jgi:ADP-heptose:LPS heptosyltransferase